jgi:hypothetical protein
MRWLLVAAILAIAFLFPATGQATVAPTFSQALGVNTHTSYTATPYTRLDINASLAYLGVSHIRDGLVPDRPDQVARLQGVNASKDLIIGGHRDHPEWGSWMTMHGRSPAEGVAVAQTIPGTIMVEGLNEPDLWNGCCRLDPEEISLTAAHQRDLFAAGRSPFRVLAPSIAFTGTGVETTNLWSPNVEGSNTHPYAKPARETVAHAAAEYAKAKSFTASVSEAQRYVYATEYGWRGGTPGGDVVSEQQAADRLASGLLELLKQGYYRVYIYELYEIGAGWGVFRADGTPKPAANAVRALTSALGAYAPVASTVPVSGDVRSSQWRRPDGSCRIALWRTTEGSTTATVNGRSVTVGPTPVVTTC